MFENDVKIFHGYLCQPLMQVFHIHNVSMLEPIFRSYTTPASHTNSMVDLDLQDIPLTGGEIVGFIVTTGYPS